MWPRSPSHIRSSTGASSLSGARVPHPLRHVRSSPSRESTSAIKPPRHDAGSRQQARATSHRSHSTTRARVAASKSMRRKDPAMSEPMVLLSGLGIPESPRWHEGRLWFCDWIDRQVLAVGLDGKPEVVLARDPASHSMGWSIDWLPDGRLLTTGAKLERQERDGSLVVHADQRANEIVVDARGNVYLNGADFDFVGGAAPKPGCIKLVTPDGQLRQVAGDAPERSAPSQSRYPAPAGHDPPPRRSGDSASCATTFLPSAPDLHNPRDHGVSLT